jgi:hypothetical protein
VTLDTDGKGVYTVRRGGYDVAGAKDFFMNIANSARGLTVTYPPHGMPFRLGRFALEG